MLPRGVRCQGIFAKPGRKASAQVLLQFPAFSNFIIYSGLFRQSVKVQTVPAAHD